MFLKGGQVSTTVIRCLLAVRCKTCNFLYGGCRIECPKDPSYSETVAISFDHVEATASCTVVLTPLSWL